MDPYSLCILEPLSCWAVNFNIPAPPPIACQLSFLGVCLVTPLTQEGKVFGFAEFVQAFALLALVYTVSDARSKFRGAIAPFRLQNVIFYASAVIGFGTLVTDIWFSQKYPLPSFLSVQIYIQAAFGTVFVLLVLLWIWYSFVSPPAFGRLNGYNFTLALYMRLLQGDDKDLPVVAGELARSAKAIIKFAPERKPLWGREANEAPPKLTRMQGYARDILLLIANRKLCRHIIASSPGTAMAFFQEMSQQKKYNLPVGQFGSNISTEALLNKDSILYHEDEGYYSGFFGYTRPFTNSIYGDYDLVEALTEGSSPLDVRMHMHGGFDADQLQVYCRAVLATFKSAIEKGNFHSHSYALARAFGNIERACSDLYKLNNADLPREERDDISGRIEAVVRFVDEAVKTLDAHGVKPTTLRRHDRPHKWRDDYYDNLAHLMFELIADASAVKTKEFLSWEIQHNSIWFRFFNFDDSKTLAIILFKLRRLLYSEILSIERFPNFRNVAIFGLCLNVSGLQVGPHKTNGEYVFRKAVIAWAKRNYLWLVKKNPKVAAVALVGKLSFDAKKKQLVKTYEEGLSRKAHQQFLKLDPPLRESVKSEK